MRAVMQAILFSLFPGIVSWSGAAYSVDVNSMDNPADAAPMRVQVAAYEYPPYYSSHQEDHLLGQLLVILNQHQQAYKFEIKEVRPAQRYQALSAEGCCMVMFFQSESWGWQEHLGELAVLGPKLSRGAEMLVRKEGNDANSAQGATIGGLIGYHYEMANYQSDRIVSEQEHNLYLADSKATLIKMLLRERLDMVLLSSEYLSMLGSKYPDIASQLEVITDTQHEYETHAVLALHSSLTPEWLEQQLSALANSGVLYDLFADFGLEPYLFIQPDTHFSSAD